MAENAEAQLRELEARRGAALVERDFASLAELLADDLVHVHSTGVRHDKAGLLAYVAGGLRFLSVERPSLRVTVLGDAALMTGPMHNRLQPPGNEPIVANAHVTQVWVRRDGRWRLAAFQATRMAEPS